MKTMSSIRRVTALLLSLIMLVGSLPLSLAEEIQNGSSVPGETIVKPAPQDPDAQEPEEAPAALTFGVTQGQPALSAAPALAGGPLRAPVPDPNAPTENLPVELDGSKVENIVISWYTPDDDGDNPYPGAGKTLYLEPDNDKPQKMVYNLDIALSGQYDYEPGDIEIEIPATIWKDRNGNPVGELRLPIPEGEDPRVDFNWRRQGDKIIIYNTRSMSAATKAHFQIEVNGIIPHTIVDMKEQADFTATVYVNTHRDNTIAMASDPLNTQMNTYAELTRSYKSGMVYTALPSALPAALRPANPGDYIYVRWETYTYHTGNQPFTLSLKDAQWVGEGNPYPYISGAYKTVVTDATTNPPTTEQQLATPAVMLGVTDGSNTYTPDGDGTVTVNCYDGYHSPTTTSYDHVHYVWTAYKKSDLPGNVMTSQEGMVDQAVYEIFNAVNWHLTEKDGPYTGPDGYLDPQEQYDKPAASKVIYSPMDFFKPTGHFMVYKWTEQEGYKDWTYGYALNKLQNGEDVEMRYVVRSDGFGYPWTYDADYAYLLSPEDRARFNAADGEGKQHFIELFGHRPYRMVTDDYATFFNFETTDLTSVDFEMTGVELAKPQVFEYRQTTGGEMGYVSAGMDKGIAYYGAVQADHWAYFRKDDPASVPDVTIYVRVGDGGDDSGMTDWVEYATASWKTGALVVTPKAGPYQRDCVLGDNLLNFPANTVDYRTELTTKEAAIIYYTYPHIVMKSTPRVRDIIEVLFQDNANPSTKFKNDDMMVAYEDADPKDDYPESEIVTLYDASRATFNAASYGVSAEKYSAEPVDDTALKRFKLHYTAAVTEQSNLKSRADYDEAVAQNIIPPETKGVWYDLLPRYVQPDLTSVKLRGGDAVTQAFAIQNYKGSGRTLLVVRADLTPAPAYKSNVGYYDKPTLEFDAYLTHDDYDLQIKNRALELLAADPTMAQDAAVSQAKAEVSSLKNYVAFESASDLRTINGQEVLGTLPGQQGENDRPDADRVNAPHNNGTPNDLPDVLKDLHPALDDERYGTVYAEDTVTVNKLDASWSELSKHVRSDLEGVWTSGLSDAANQVNVYEGQKYSYRLMLATTANTQMSDIVFYDALEWLVPGDPTFYHGPTQTAMEDGAEVTEYSDWDGAWEGRGQWRGALQAIDLGELMARYPDLEPVVYVNRGDGEFKFADSGSQPTQEEIAALETDPTYNLSSTLWQVLPQGDWANPAALANVQAVAVDLRKNDDGSDFVLPKDSNIAIYLRYKAPVDQAARGAYIHIDPNGGDEESNIDWDLARNPDNNMHAFNNVRSKFTTQQVDAAGTPISSTSEKNMIRHDYTKVGIMPLSVAVEKAWADNNNHDGQRPEEVTLELWRTVYVEGQGFVDEYTGKSATVSENTKYTDEQGNEHTWYARFDQLTPEDVNGNAITYFVKEVMPAGVEGYFSTFSRISGQSYRLTNHRQNEKAELSGVKQWDDNDNQNAARPNAVQLSLYADGKFVKSITVTPNAQGIWAWSFNGLDKYEDFNITLQNDPTATQPREIVYTVQEKYVSGYTGDAVAAPVDPSLPIVNTYNPKGNLQVSKTVEKSTNADQPFSFRLYLFEPGNPDQGLADVYNYTIDHADGSVTNGIIGNGGSFTLKAGDVLTVVDLPSESTYRVEEDEAPGYTAAVRNGSGVIRAGEYNAVTAEFKNTYSAQGSIQLSLTKTLTGHDMSRAQFRFQLLDESGAVLRSTSNGMPGSDGSALAYFSPLRYTLEDLKNDDGSYAPSKTFTYKVAEEDRGRPGYTYDDAVYTVNVTVTDNGDGTLAVTADKGADDLAFENEYKAEGDVNLKVWKELTGRKLQDQEFEFELYYGGVYDSPDAVQAAGSIALPGEPLQTKINDQNGETLFDSLHFVQNGDDAISRSGLTFTGPVAGKTFLFLAKEKKGKDPTVIYTDHVHAFTVTVLDNNDGTLTYTLGNQVASWPTVCPYCQGEGVIEGDYTSEGSFGGAITQYIMSGNAYWLLRDEYSDFDDNGIKHTPIYYYKKNSENTEGRALFESLVCSVCKGAKKRNGVDCAACLGTGINEEIIAFAQSEGGFYPVNELVKFRTITGNQVMVYGSTLTPYYDKTDENGVVIRHMFSRTGGGVAYYTFCEDCNGTGEVNGPITVSGDAAIPLFTNELKPGGFSLTKEIDGADGDPLTPFTFKVKLQNSYTVLPTSIPMDMEGTPAPTPVPAPTEQPLDTVPPRELYTVEPTAVPANPFDDYTAPPPLDECFVTLNGSTDWSTCTTGRNSFQWRIEDDKLKIRPVQEGGVAVLDGASFGYYPWENQTPWRSYKNNFNDVELVGNAKLLTGDGLFAKCWGLENLDGLQNLDTSECTSVKYMFFQGYGLTDANLSSWNVNEIKDFRDMFWECERLKTADISGWNFANAEDISDLFGICIKLESINTSGISGGEKITKAGDLFMYCAYLEELDLSGLHIKLEGYNLARAFDQMAELKKLNLSNWDLSGITISSFDHPLLGAEKLEEIIANNAKITILGLPDYDWLQYGEIGNDGLLSRVTLEGGQPANEVKNLLNVHKRGRDGTLTGSNGQYVDAFVIEGGDGTTYSLNEIGSVVAGATGPITVVRQRHVRTLSFDLNGQGGVDAPDDKDFWTGDYNDCLYVLPALEGNTEKTFLGWSTSASATEPEFYAGDQVLLKNKLASGDPVNVLWGDNIKLYAVYDHAGEFTVKFSGGEGDDAADMGSLPAQYGMPGVAMTLPDTGSFYKHGYRQTGWRLPDGTVVLGSHVLTTEETAAFDPSTVLNITPVFEAIATSMQVENNEFTITLYGGETATFDNLPAGTSYQIYELTPEGWVLLDQQHSSGVIQPNEIADACKAVFTNKYSPDEVQARFFATKLKKATPADNAVTEAAEPEDGFTFELWQGSTLIAEGITVQPGGFVEFPALKYTTADPAPEGYTGANVADLPQTFHYTLKETVGDDDGWIYDSTTYDITVTVDKDGEGPLTASVSLPAGLSDMSGLVFTNVRRYGSLELKKLTRHATATANDNGEFEFTFTFTDAKGSPLDDVWYYIVDENGNPVIQPTRGAQQNAGAPTRLMSAPLRNGGSEYNSYKEPTPVDTSKQFHISDLTPEEREAYGLDTPEKAESYGLLVSNGDGTQTLYFVRGPVGAANGTNAGGSSLVKPNYTYITPDGESLTGVLCAMNPSQWYYLVGWQQTKAAESLGEDLKISAIKCLEPVQAKTMQHWFEKGTLVADAKDVDFSLLDTSQVSSFNKAFENAVITNGALDLRSFDTGSAEDFENMFYGVTAPSINLSSFDTSRVTTMKQMFREANLGGLDVSSFNTSGVKTMSSMFMRATVPTLDLSNFDVSNTYTSNGIYQIFQGTEVDTISIAGWKAPEGARTDWWQYMWKNADNTGQTILCTVKHLDLRGFDSSNIISNDSGYPYWYHLKLESLTLDDNTKVQTTRDNGTPNSEAISFDTSITVDGGEASKWVYNPEMPEGEQYIYQNGFTQIKNFGPGTWKLAEHVNVVKFDANGGTGSADDIVVHSYDGEVALPSLEGFSRPGWKPEKWVTGPQSSSSSPDIIRYDEEEDTYYFKYSGSQYDEGRPSATRPQFGIINPTTLYVRWVPDKENGFDFPVEYYHEKVDKSGYVLAGTELAHGVIGEGMYVKPKTFEGYEFNNTKSYPRMYYYSQQGGYTTYASPSSDTFIFKFYYDRISYNVTFDGNGGSGSMEDMTNLLGDVNYTLPANGFTKANSKFIGWKLTKVNSANITDGADYVDRATIKNLAMRTDGTTPNNATAVLTAQWLTIEPTNYDATTGKVTVKLKEGQTVIFPELPDGATWTAEETDVPAGWTWISTEPDHGRIAGGETIHADALNEYDAQGQAAIEATKILIGGTPEAGQFTFRLYANALDANARNDNYIYQADNGAIDTAETIPDPAAAGDPTSTATIPNPNYGKSVARLGILTYTLEDLQEDVTPLQDDAGTALTGVEWNGSKTFTYYLVEVIPQPGDPGYDPAIDYDPTVKTVTVTVTDNGQGSLDTAVTVTGGSKTAFENQYKHTELQLTKTVVGGTEVSNAREFTVTLTLNDAQGNPLPGTYPITRNGTADGKITVGDEGTGTLIIHKDDVVVIGELPHRAGYTIVETDLPGFTANYTGESGTLNYIGDATVEAEAAIENVYEAAGVWNLGGEKTLTGRKMQYQQFIFTLEDEGGNVLQAVRNGTVNDAGNEADFAFAPIEYTAEDVGEHTYILRESDLGAGGYTYSDRVYTYTVTVTDNGDGTLGVVPVFNVQSETDPVTTTDLVEPIFNNKYQAHGEYPVTVSKALAGRPLEAYGFTFVLEAVSGTDAEGAAIALTDIPLPTEQTTLNDADGTVEFPEIEFDLIHDGCTFVYHVTERAPQGATENQDGTYTKDGVTYDPMVRTLTLTVTDKGDGTLEIADTWDNPDTEYNNSYYASGFAQMKADKVFTGRAWKTGDSFTFELTPVDGAPLKVKNAQEKIAAVAAGKLTVTVDSEAALEKTFDTLWFENTDLAPDTNDPTTLTGTFQYEIREAHAGKTIDGIAYTSAVYTVSVTVTDSKAGTLITGVSYALDGDSVDKATFENKYDTEDTQAQIEVRKQLAGRSWQAGDSFGFILTGGDADTPMPAAGGESAQVVYGDGFVTGSTDTKASAFGIIPYTHDHLKNADGTYAAEKTFHYEIVEVIPDAAVGANRKTYGEYIVDDETPVGPFTLNGVTYTSDTHSVTVTLTDNQDGTLSAEVKYGPNHDSPTPVAFVNHYESKPDRLTLEAEKVLTGRALKTSEFAFALLDENGQKLQDTANRADGSIVFAELTYTLEDVARSPIRYTIAEIKGTDAAITYDEHTVEVTVIVTDDGTGQVKAETVYTGGTLFTNKYSAKGEVVLRGTKRMLDRAKPLAAGEFTFELLDENKHPLLDGDSQPIRVRNDAQGAVVFPAIAYTEQELSKSPITYYIREVPGEQAHVIRYDDHVESVQVFLTDDGRGTITATAQYDENGMVFVNVFNPGSVSLTGAKTWIDGEAAHVNSEDVTLRLWRTSARPGAEAEEVTGAAPIWRGDTYTFADLKQYDEDGYEYTYHVTETAVKGYKAPVYSDGDRALNGGGITNEITGVTKLTGTKVWVDGGKAHDNGQEVVLTLWRVSAKAGAAEETVIGVTPAWSGDKYTYADLAKYDKEGYEYIYFVTEDQVSRYEAPVYSDGDRALNDGTIINRVVGTVKLSGTKVWVDGGKKHNNADDVQLALKRISSKAGAVEETLEGEEPTWQEDTYTFADLTRYDVEGYKYTYYVTETQVEGYEAPIYSDTYYAMDGGKITNIVTGMTEISGKKIWMDGNKPHDNAKEITLILTRKLDREGAETETLDLTPVWEGDTYTFSNLPKYDEAGYAYLYDVNEEPVAGYEKPVKNGTNFMNKIIPPTPTVTVTPQPTVTPVPNEFYFSFRKEWKGTPQEDITFTLYNPNGTVRQHRFNKRQISATEWIYEAWISTAADYYVIEAPMDGYTTVYRNVGEHRGETSRVYNGGTIINSVVPRTGDTRNTALWTGLTGASLLGMAAVALMARKKRKNGHA